jgi:serine/threonine protein kinase
MENTLAASDAATASTEQIGPYRLLHEIARSPKSTVYAAEDLHSRRQLAVKVLQHSEHRIKEARTLTHVNHEHLVQLHEVIENEGKDYLVMELLKGETLQTRLSREHRLPLREAMRIARETAAGLAFAHALGLVHRDVCPANIWLEPSGRTRLLGLGSAAEQDDDSLLGRLGESGTPGYLSPEQAAGEPITPVSDLFGLGSVLYQMATGERPFRGENPQALTRAIVFEHPKSARDIHPEISEPLDELISRLLAKLPAARPASAQEVDHRLMEWLDPTAPKPALLPSRLPEPFVYPASKRILESLNAAKNEMSDSTQPNVNEKTASIPAPAPAAPQKRKSWLPDVIAAIILLAAGTALFFWWRASKEMRQPEPPAKAELSTEAK